MRRGCAWGGEQPGSCERCCLGGVRRRAAGEQVVVVGGTGRLRRGLGSIPWDRVAHRPRSLLASLTVEEAPPVSGCGVSGGGA